VSHLSSMSTYTSGSAADVGPAKRSAGAYELICQEFSRPYTTLSSSLHSSVQFLTGFRNTVIIVCATRYNSSVGMKTGSIPGRGKRFVSSAEHPYRLWDLPSQPSIQWVPGALSPGVKWPGHEANHSPPSSAEVKNVEAMPPPLHTSS
jgi:hypothetical protein